MSDKPTKTRKTKTETVALEPVDLGTVVMQSADLLPAEESVTLGIYANHEVEQGIGVPETPGSAGADLSARLPEGSVVNTFDALGKAQERRVKDGGVVYLEPMDRALIPTGIHMDIPHGYMVNIFPRSGSSLKKALHLNNSVAIIDSDYTGEIMISVFNASQTRMAIRDGERIAQFVVTPVVHLPVVRLTSVPSKEGRGVGGFGSTGI